MAKQLTVATAEELQLIDDIASFTHDPYGFALYAFPWGQEGELEKFSGPDTWQTDVLNDIGEQLRTQVRYGDDFNAIVREAVVSGNGIGKSALIDILALWGISTFEDTLGVITAGTDTQLKTKVWAQLSKWHRLCICGHWFEYTATALYSKSPGHERTWRIDAIPWNKSRPDAFAGLHNQNRRVLIMCDEASAIDNVIHDIIQGALTDANTEIIWIAFGNGVRNTGWFRECFRKQRHRWRGRQIDSRTAMLSNKELLNQWVEDYGEDSDFVKVHVKGEFPNASDMQFIPESIVTAARGRHIPKNQYNYAAKIITCDPAWTGGDETVIWLRQGLASQKLAVYPRNDDDGVIAGYLMNFEDEKSEDDVFIDAGYGHGIYSFGKQLGRQWTLVEFGSASSDPAYLNKRAEMWGLMKKWLKEGGAIPDDPQLADELTSVEYFVVPTGPNAGRIQLESKKDIKARGLPSPNRADALALSFAYPVLPKQQKFGGEKGQFAQHEFDPLAER